MAKQKPAQRERDAALAAYMPHEHEELLASLRRRRRRPRPIVAGDLVKHAAA